MSEQDDAYVTICIPATAGFMRVVREAIQQAAEDFGFSEDDGAQIVMAVDEASTNVVQHGKGEDPEHHLKLYLRVVFSKDRLIVELVDEAQRFSPARKQRTDRGRISGQRQDPRDRAVGHSYSGR